MWHFSQRWGTGGLSLTRYLCSPPPSASSHTMKGLWDTHTSPYCGPCVQTLCTPSAILCPLLFCAPGTMGRARVVLGPCFRVGLECIRALVCLTLLPARCLCASLWFQARWCCPPREATSRDSGGGRGRGCHPISLQQGAPALRGEAALQPCCGRRADWGLRETALGRVRAFRNLKILHLVQKGKLRLRKRVAG